MITFNFKMGWWDGGSQVQAPWGALQGRFGGLGFLTQLKKIVKNYMIIVCAFLKQ